MDTVTLSRAFFGTTLAFHIIFATLSVGISAMIFLSELIYFKTRDRDYALMAKRWTKTLAILLGVAIPSGTIVGVEIALLWPGFMKIVGQVISVPFQIEIFAFFIEAVAMSIYVYGADRLTPILRLFNVFLVAFGATASAVLITSANAWMNTPAGFEMRPDGTVYNVDVWKAFFNPGFFTSSYHVVVTALMTGSFAIVSVAAYRLLKGNLNDREKGFHRKSLTLSLIVAFIMSVLSTQSGHVAAQVLHRHAPQKLAAAEGLFETQRNAPLVIGGVTDLEERKVKYGFEIPGLLSWLAGGSFETEVKGLNEFPKDTWPPAYVHALFNLMVGVGSLLLLLSGIALFYCWWRRRQQKPLPNSLLKLLIVSGPLSMLGIEIGWIFSCSGRQPWTIYGFQRTTEAATHSESVGWLFVLFILVYLLLSIFLIIVLRYYFRKNPLHKELS